MDKDNNFTWNSPKIKLPIKRAEGWMTESVPVLCKVKYKGGKGFCVCTYNTYKNSGSKEWEPEIEHLRASTMPCADYNIEPEEGFKVLEWMLIPEDVI